MSIPRRPFRRPGRSGAIAAVCAGALLAACGDDTGTGPGTTVPPVNAKTYTLGERLRLNVQTDNACTNATFTTGRVAAIGQRAVIVADTSNPAGGFTDADYASIAAQFDTLVYPVNTRLFGTPTDLDDNGKVIIFYTKAVNELTPAGVNYVVGGFFWNRDIFPKTAANPNAACAGSNDGELFYMLAPDPNGAVNGNARSTASVRNSTVAVIAHEFQHLISATRRLYEVETDNFDEEIWLNEGLSHIAEEATFYQAAGLSPAGQAGQSPRADVARTAVASASAPRANAAVNAYGIQNLGRISVYLRAPEDTSVYAPDDGLATRGATWAFLRYAADRLNGNDSTFFYRLVNNNQLGITNLRVATGAGPALDDWFRDWAVANYADNLTESVSDARFTYRSWNFRSLLPALQSNSNAYPLATIPLANGATRVDSVVGGSAAYFRFNVASGAAATLRTRGEGEATSSSLLRLALVRSSGSETTVTTYDPGAGADITLNTAGEYALVAYNTNPEPFQRAVISVTGTGILTPPSDALAQVGPTLARLAEGALAGPTVTDAPVLARLQAVGRRELTGRVSAARAEYRERLRERRAERGR